ncbi:uncharacterized protein HMPREF1541_03434 [Cyphellophora europaea CBS 101466]|uniref:Uncharacterized protein n=1 Tax=Cyphellophora europaea (strain CBS 101466) TaxID=1220924 RepID=W2S0E1_CYPE1|nr:uncharacterized protein HMPREF1541_03434 [Cyphellophora europaea CBS 101466]ETN41498.1 hypothetical protein HMPREF1541_03434 [Cyphellophora europaea CBS 101466]
MAARTRPLTNLLTAFRPSTTSTSLRCLTITFHSNTRPFHHFTPLAYPAATSLPNSTTQQTTASTPPPPPQGTSTPLDTRNAAFLGESDSNDLHELNLTTDPPPQPALDAQHAAFLGEADSDDGFEAHKDAHGKVEAVDASQSAFLGEADSDDGFESHVEVYPEKHRHELGEESVRGSAVHGESGEGEGRL